MNPAEHIKEWCRENSYYRDENLFTRRLRERGLTDEQICIVLDVLDGVCHGCWNRDGICFCLNDE